jgi:hypothetical protein
VIGPSESCLSARLVSIRTLGSASVAAAGPAARRAVPSTARRAGRQVEATVRGTRSTAEPAVDCGRGLLIRWLATARRSRAADRPVSPLASWRLSVSARLRQLRGSARAAGCCASDCARNAVTQNHGERAAARNWACAPAQSAVARWRVPERVRHRRSSRHASRGPRFVRRVRCRR